MRLSITPNHLFPGHRGRLISVTTGLVLIPHILVLGQLNSDFGGSFWPDCLAKNLGQGSASRLFVDIGGNPLPPGHLGEEHGFESAYSGPLVIGGNSLPSDLLDKELTLEHGSEPFVDIGGNPLPPDRLGEELALDSASDIFDDIGGNSLLLDYRVKDIELNLVSDSFEDTSDNTKESLKPSTNIGRGGDFVEVLDDSAPFGKLTVNKERSEVVSIKNKEKRNISALSKLTRDDLKDRDGINLCGFPGCESYAPDFTCTMAKDEGELDPAHEHGVHARVKLIYNVEVDSCKSAIEFWIGVLFALAAIYVLIVFTPSSRTNHTFRSLNAPLEKKGTFKVSAWKRIFVASLVFSCSVHTTQASKNEKNPKPLSLKEGMEKIQDISHSLRGGEGKEENPASMMKNLRGILKSFSHSLSDIQGRQQRGDAEGAGQTLKTLMEDVPSLLTMSDEVEHTQVPTQLSKDDVLSLNQVTDAQLGGSMHPRVVDGLADFTREFSNMLEDMDLSALSTLYNQKKQRQSHAYATTDHMKSHGDLYNDLPFEFKENESNFHSSSSHFNTDFSYPSSKENSNFDMHSSIIKLQQSKFQRKGTAVNLPKISTFISRPDHDIVMAKHQLRQTAIGDVCLPQCSPADAMCNCARLFQCAKQIDEYDLAVLTASGYIDKNPGSNNYGSFSISAQNLNLFNLDNNLGQKLLDIKALVDSSSESSQAQCKAVLEHFHSACDTTKASCSRSNSQSFQVTVDEVCAAVNTQTKLKFEAILDEFDGFVGGSGVLTTLEPLSYNTCRDFVTQFDHLYEGRNKTIYPHSNPMKKLPNKKLNYTSTNKEFFDQTQFPLEYTFNQDQYGLVTRTFGEQDFHGSSLFDRKFSLVSSKTGKALGVQDCNQTRLVTKVYNKSEPFQQFKLTKRDQLEIVGCTGKVVTAQTYCEDGRGLSIESPVLPSSANSSPAPVPAIRYVKVSLTGPNKVVHLSEVQVFAMINGVETNVALASSGATATQSSTYSADFPASNAINGQHTGKTSDISHTNFESNPWWEVDLHSPVVVTRVIVYNRIDCCSERLSGAKLSLFAADRTVVEEFNLGDTAGQLKFDTSILSSIQYQYFGSGICSDFHNNWYTTVVSPTFAQVRDSDCLDWCSLNPHKDLVGAEVARSNAGLVRSTIRGSIRGEVLTLRIEHDQRAEHMTLSEVEVYDASNVNQALRKAVAQSSTGAYPANLGNDGDKNTFFSTEKEQGAWWQVELDAVDVRKIKIFQRDCCKFASNARVLLLDQQYRVFGMYRIGNVTNVPSFEININDFQPPIRGVRSVYIEHDQRAEYMTLSEVEVYDASNVNVAKSMVASQSSTGAYPANLGNDGDKNTFFSTEKEKPAWWQVSGVLEIEVVKIKIFQRNCCKFASGARVVLADENGWAIASYRIGDVSSASSFEIDVSGFNYEPYAAVCLCNFAGSVPGSINLSDYTPAAKTIYTGTGVGDVRGGNGSSDNTCYRNILYHDPAIPTPPSTLQSQQWRFYNDRIENLECGRTNGNLAITEIEDDSYNGIPFLGNVGWSFVNPYNGKAIGIGSAVTLTPLDIGAVGLLGSAVTTNGRVMVRGSGSDIDKNQFQFYHTNMNGNVEMEMLVESFTAFDPWAKGGIMIRESLRTDSKYFSVFLTGSNGLLVLCRSDANSQPFEIPLSTLLDKQLYLKITKQGGVWRAYYRKIGFTFWEAIGHEIDFPFTNDFFVGVAVTSHDNSKVAELNANHVVLNSANGPVHVGGQYINLQNHIEGNSYQLFKINQVINPDGTVANGLFTISHASHSHLLVTLFDGICQSGASVELMQDNNLDYQKWELTGNGIQSVHCKNLFIDQVGDKIRVIEKNYEASQKWTAKSSDVILFGSTATSANSQASSSARTLPQNSNPPWSPEFVDPGFELGLNPGFPGILELDGKLSSVNDGDLAKHAMHICDESMNLLIGSKMSVGTLKSIADLVHKNGPDMMPGYCCMDIAINSEFFGYEFDPTMNRTNVPMQCQNRGLWHLGLSDEACANAGGKWYRNPCIALKGAIDNSPSRFDLQNPFNSTCQDVSGQLETAFALSLPTDHVDFPFKSSTVLVDLCSSFCKSLPGYSSQLNMEVITGNRTGTGICACTYQNDMMPSSSLMPKYAIVSPPPFTITNSLGMALGIRPGIWCNSTVDLDLETQVSNPNDPRQQFQVTKDGRIVSVRCPTKVLAPVSDIAGSCTNGIALHLSNIALSVPHQNIQQWSFNNDGSVSNTKCSNLVISSNKEKDVSLNSIYFALQNPRTQLAIGIKGLVTDCTDGMMLEMQDLMYGSQNQQFIYRANDNTIVSLICPNHAITVPNGDCASKNGLYLSSMSNVDNRDKWLFIQQGQVIQSLLCKDLFITINNVLGRRAQITADSSQILLNESNLPQSPVENTTSYTNATNGNKKVVNSTSYTSATHTQTTWGSAKPPTVGSQIILSGMNAATYQKWIQQHQVLTPLMGPFSIVSNNGNAMTVKSGTCASGMPLESAIDDHTSTAQKFYLGQHGSIFSAACPGLVFSADSASVVTLQTFRLGHNNTKWKFINEMVESVMYPGVVIANNANNVLSLQHKTSVSSSQATWRRTNTRLLPATNLNTWDQKWTLSFVTSPGYKRSDLQNSILRYQPTASKCYKSSPAFSASFEKFANTIAIKDASDQEQCGEAREQLGFDKDHPHDTEVVDSFHQKMCDPYFVGIDHMSQKPSPPKFDSVEYTPVEYEAVEYKPQDQYMAVGYTRKEAFVTKDYEAFTNGDNMGALTETIWPNVNKATAGVGDLTGIFKHDDPATDQSAVKIVEGQVIRAEYLLLVFEQVYNFQDGFQEAFCKAQPETCPIPNFGKSLCFILNSVAKSIGFALLTVVRLAYQILNTELNSVSLGGDQQIYGYYYSRAVYMNLQDFSDWNVKALDALRVNMKNQHMEMKKQLQERHKDIANHVGQDIADTENALGQAIVDSQNALGLSIVDSQNANGQAIVDSKNELSREIVDSQNALGQIIVDSQNALGQDIVDAQNSITLQHNVLGEWLHTTLCAIYAQQGGVCTKMIGPLEETHAFIPMEVHWPDGRTNMMERLEQISTVLSNSEMGGEATNTQDDNNSRDHANTYSKMGHMEELKGKMDAMKQEMKDQVDAVQGELKELKGMISKLMDKLG